MARRILLADDSVTAQNMGRRILTDAGYEVLTVNNGSAALKKIAEHKPDLIVLDVYMPGYGGLEVCQRVKESSETRQIPVLLTVGKLEPFKQEEARRVGADAFIIKPFEATELLTVLTRLEDKIVAQPQQKTGRFAKALAAVEQSDRFGDKETGWKNRLTIPRPGTKPKGEEEAPEAVASAPAGLQPGAAEPLVSEHYVSPPADTVHPAEPSRDFERPIPAGLPADITPEEIAAITAAAAAFGGKVESNEAVAEPVAADSAASPQIAPAEVASSDIASPEIASPEIAQIPATEPEPASATLDAVPQAENTHVEVPAEVQPPAAQVEAAAASEPAKAEDLPAAPMVEAAPETAAAEARISEPEKAAGNDDDVMAAIASLAPSNGNASESLHPGAPGGNGTAQAYASAISSGATGPRWIAEAVAVGVEELKLALDQEMELAHAARAVTHSSGFASASAGEIPSSTEAISLSETSVAAESVSAAMAAQPIAAESAVAESAITESSIVEVPVAESPVVESSAVEALNRESVTAESQTVESSLSESTIEASAAAAVGVETSNFAPSTVEASVVAAPSFESSFAESSSVQQAEPAPVTAVTAKEEAAFAAAASAGGAPEYPSPADAASLNTAAPELPQSRPAVPEAEPQREAELAAAWKNWKQIRESMLEPASASQAAEAAAVEESSQVQEEEVSSAPAETVAEAEAATAEAPEESTAIASIVDTMLAELRPKLVAEIAKKMGSEKEKKEKDKKKKK